MLGQYGIFALVRAASDEQARPGGHSELAQHRQDIQGAALGNDRRVEFQTADHVDGFRAAPQRAQFRCVFFILGAHGREGGEERPKQKAKAPVTTVRASR